VSACHGRAKTDASGRIDRDCRLSSHHATAPSPPPDCLPSLRRRPLSQSRWQFISAASHPPSSLTRGSLRTRPLCAHPTCACAACRAGRHTHQRCITRRVPPSRPSHRPSRLAASLNEARPPLTACALHCARPPCPQSGTPTMCATSPNPWALLHSPTTWSKSSPATSTSALPRCWRRPSSSCDTGSGRR
jgi:hypothetical protein